MKSWLVFYVLVGAVTFTTAYYGPDLVGDYCGGPRNRCCDGRIDSCAVPILGTFCYCDQFCNRTDSSDCCPDYWSVCLGIEPPAALEAPKSGEQIVHLIIICVTICFNVLLTSGCYHDGQLYPYGETVRINCNKW